MGDVDEANKTVNDLMDTSSVIFGLEEGNDYFVFHVLCDTRHFPDDATRVFYHELFYRNKEVMRSVGSSTYGEINKSEVPLQIRKKEKTQIEGPNLKAPTQS